MPDSTCVPVDAMSRVSFVRFEPTDALRGKGQSTPEAAAAVVDNVENTHTVRGGGRGSRCVARARMRSAACRAGSVAEVGSRQGPVQGVQAAVCVLDCGAQHGQVTGKGGDGPSHPVTGG